MNKKVLSVDDILNADDVQPVEVDCPEWGGVVLVGPLSAEAADIAQFGTLGKDGRPQIDKMAGKTAEIVVLGTIDPKFDHADLDRLQKKNSAPVRRIANKIMQLSGMLPGPAGLPPINEAKKG